MYAQQQHQATARAATGEQLYMNLDTAWTASSHEDHPDHERAVGDLEKMYEVKILLRVYFL